MRWGSEEETRNKDRCERKNYFFYLERCEKRNFFHAHTANCFLIAFRYKNNINRLFLSEFFGIFPHRVIPLTCFSSSFSLFSYKRLNRDIFSMTSSDFFLPFSAFFSHRSKEYSFVVFVSRLSHANNSLMPIWRTKLSFKYRGRLYIMDINRIFIFLKCKNSPQEYSQHHIESYGPMTPHIIHLNMCAVQEGKWTCWIARHLAVKEGRASGNKLSI